MSKFIVVKEAPTELKNGEYLIDHPSFKEQIALHKAKQPRNGLTGSHFIRMVADSIAQAYDPDNMTAYSIKAHLYEGRSFSSDEDLDKIFVEAMRADCPQVFTKYLDAKIRNRPAKTDLVIYVDSKIPFQYEQFYKNGLSEVVPEKPQKPKYDKPVGKPALTKEQAEARKAQLQSQDSEEQIKND